MGWPFASRVLVAALVMLTGCSLLTSLSDLSGGTIDAPEGGTNPSPEARDEDAHASTPNDAATDDPDVSAPPSCSGDVFCDGFERTDVLGAWDLIAGANGSISIATDAPRSGTSFLRIVLPGAEGGAKALHRTFAPAKKEKMSFSVRVDSAGRHMNVGALDFDYGDHMVGVFFVFHDGNATLTEQAMPANTYYERVSRPMPTGRWVDVSIAIDHTTKPQRVTATFDGETIAQDIPLMHDVPSQQSTAIAGTDYAGAGSNVTVDVDDVRVEWTPL